MPLDQHTIEVPDGASPANTDRTIIGSVPNVANIAGGSAGASVTVAVAMANLPANYSVLVNPGQDATWFVGSKTSSGFTVTLNPRLATNTLAAGTIDVVVVA